MAAKVITDKVAKRLWLITTLVVVSAYPLATLSTVNYFAWSPDVSKTVAEALVTWAGSVAAVLGLSRYAPSNTANTTNN